MILVGSWGCLPSLRVEQFHISGLGNTILTLVSENPLLTIRARVILDTVESPARPASSRAKGFGSRIFPGGVNWMAFSTWFRCVPRGPHFEVSLE